MTEGPINIPEQRTISCSVMKNPQMQRVSKRTTHLRKDRREWGLISDPQTGINMYQKRKI